MQTEAEIHYYEAYRRDALCVVCDWIIAALVLVGVIACIYMTGEYFKAKASADRAEAEANSYFAAHPGMEVR